MYLAHGQFQRARLRGRCPDGRRVSMKPSCLITARMGVFFSRTLSRLSSSEVGTARCTRSAFERAMATSEPRAPQIFRLTLRGGPWLPSSTATFGGAMPPKHQHWQLSGSSELAMQPHPFLHSASHSPAPHFAIRHPRKMVVKGGPQPITFRLPYHPRFAEESGAVRS